MAMSKGTGPLSRFYNLIVGTADKFVPERFHPLWHHPAGPRTVFFWGPLFKWTLVLAGLGDIITRPPQNISLKQCFVIATTGLIWSRFSMVITPVNHSLFAVNMFIFLTQGFLVYRVLKYRHDNPQATDYKHPHYSHWPDDEW